MVGALCRAKGAFGLRNPVGLAVVLLASAWLAAPARASSSFPYPDRCHDAAVTDPAYGGDARVQPLNLGGFAVQVLLPDGYGASRRRYPVLYLLHGATHNQDMWLEDSDLVSFTARFTGRDAAIVVMPVGDILGVSLDWRSQRRAWDSFYIDELIPYVDSHFRTLADRSQRAVAGVSGGGFSAMHLATLRPDVFVSAGSFSGLPLDPAGDSPGDETVLFPAERLMNACAGGSPADDGPLGDPLTDDVWWHDVSPTDRAGNLRGASVYVASGDGTPCDAQDVAVLATGGPLTLLDLAAHEQAQGFETGLRTAHVPFTNDLYGCGIHTFRYFQPDLHRYWSQMVQAFGTPPPAAFDYRSAHTAFSVWGWSFKADPKRAAEFLDIHDASRAGLTLTGSGIETVTTAAYFRPGRSIQVSDSSGSRTVSADGTGRISLTVDLGSPHPNQQYTLQSKLAGQDSAGYFVTRKVTFTPLPGARRRHHRRRHRS